MVWKTMLGFELLALMALIVLFAYFVKGIMGFAEGMILMSFFLLLVDIKFALPLALIIMLSGDINSIFRLWKKVEFDIMKLVLVPSIVGVFFGALILSLLDSSLVQSAFGVIVVLLALKMLIEKKEVVRGRIKRRWGILAGFIGGVLESLFSSSGPPVVLYLQRVGLKKAEFRATCVAFFTVFNLARLPAYYFTGLLNSEIVSAGVVLLPLMFLGTFIGMRAHHKVDELLFKKFVAVLLFLIGLRLIF